MTIYKSSVMISHDPDDTSCPVCVYINGDGKFDYHNETALARVDKVIVLLDTKLAEKEDQCNKMTEVLTRLKSDYDSLMKNYQTICNRN